MGKGGCLAFIISWPGPTNSLNEPVLQPPLHGIHNTLSARMSVPLTCCRLCGCFMLCCCCFFLWLQEHLILVCELLRANLYEFQKYQRENGDDPYFTPPRIQRIAIQVSSGKQTNTVPRSASATLPCCSLNTTECAT